jgi:hypothetical protein
MKWGLLGGLLALAAVAASNALAAPSPTRWCGSDETAADRLPDAVASYQLHAVYAIPSDGTDRFVSFALPIARDLAAIDSWWRQQDPARTLRWDLHVFPDCDTAFGGLDLSFVRLPQPGSAYADVGGFGYGALRRDLTVTLTNQYKKYAVYYDGPVTPGAGICGVSSFGPVDASSLSFTYVNGDPGGHCGSVGAADYMAETMAHEIIHGLGAVSENAPHECSDGHVCDVANDIMRPFGISNSLTDYALDVGRDDYYGHSGAWWDVQDSPWLSHLDAPQFALSVGVTGGGSGQVTSELPGIACPPACSIAWDSGTVVRLLPQATGDRSRFAGWSGPCSGDACVLTMDAAKSVTATFEAQRSLTVSVVEAGGAGRVSSRPEGLDCPVAACDSLFDVRTSVVLIATPDARSRVLGWSLQACGSRQTCSVVLTEDRAVTVRFAPRAYRLTAAVSGKGRVTSNPSGLACTTSCSASFPYGRRIRVIATPAKAWRFSGWSGACHGRGACFVQVTKASLVRATFRRA